MTKNPTGNTVGNNFSSHMTARHRAKSENAEAAKHKTNLRYFLVQKYEKNI